MMTMRAFRILRKRPEMTKITSRNIADISGALFTLRIQFEYTQTQGVG